jgi:hypothetical protein
MGSAINQKKRIVRLGLVLHNTHAQGLTYGPDFSHLDPLPQVESGMVIDANAVWADYDFDAVEFNDTYTTDSRLCLVANAPRPCTLLSAIVEVKTDEKL